LVVASFTLALSGFVACATSAEKKDFGEDFSDAGNDAKVVPVGDSSTPPQDGSVTPTDGSVEPPTDGSVTPDSSTPDASTCASQIAVLAGSETGLSGAVRAASGWSTQALTGESATSGPAVVSTGTGFAAVFRASGDALKSTQVTGTTWSAPARIATASTRSTPSLALAGTTLHVAYQDLSFQFVHSANSGAAWATPDAVGSPQSFGPEAPSAVAVGTSVVLAFGGSAEGPLYTQVLTGTTWEGAAQVSGTSVCATAGGGATTRCGGAPGFLATGGATADVLAIHIDKSTRQLTASTRNATTKAFTAHGAIGAGVTSDDEVFLAKAGASRAVLAFRGQDGKGYAALADLSASPPTWSAPVALSSGGILGVPRVATGVCGDDAEAVFVTSAGAVRLVHLKGTTWGSEEAVGTIAGAKVAAVATRP
jgi:hypothetical protein